MTLDTKAYPHPFISTGSSVEGCVGKCHCPSYNDMKKSHCVRYGGDTIYTFLSQNQEKVISNGTKSTSTGNEGVGV